MPYTQRKGMRKNRRKDNNKSLYLWEHIRLHLYISFLYSIRQESFLFPLIIILITYYSAKIKLLQKYEEENTQGSKRKFNSIVLLMRSRSCCKLVRNTRKEISKRLKMIAKVVLKLSRKSSCNPWKIQINSISGTPDHLRTIYRVWNNVQCFCMKDGKIHHLFCSR